MLRRALGAKTPKVDRLGFRYRGSEVSRLECFTDCVFAFALTLIVVSLEVPKSYVAMIDALRNFPGFGVCFLFLFSVWGQHNMFYRRYGLDDSVVKAVTGVLLFIILAFVYPLKFVMNLFVNGMILQTLSKQFTIEITPHQVRELFILYGVGFFLIHMVFAVLYRYAYHRRDALALDELETAITHAWFMEQLYLLCVPLLAIVLALVLPVTVAGLSGFTYCLVGFVIGTCAGMQRRISEKIRQAEAT